MGSWHTVLNPCTEFGHMQWGLFKEDKKISTFIFCVLLKFCFSFFLSFLFFFQGRRYYTLFLESLVLRDIEIAYTVSKSWALFLEFCTTHAIVSTYRFFCSSFHTSLSRNIRSSAHLESLTWRKFAVPPAIFGIYYNP